MFPQFGVSDEQVVLLNCVFVLLFYVVITNKMYCQTDKLQRTMLLLLLPRAPFSSSSWLSVQLVLLMLNVWHRLLFPLSF